MVRKLRINEDNEMRSYRVTFFFNDCIVSTFIYVEATNKDEAIKKATDEIAKKFKIKNIRKHNEEEYAVTIDLLNNWATYTVYEDNRNSAKEAAIERAIYDLDVDTIDDITLGFGEYHYNGK